MCSILSITKAQTGMKKKILPKPFLAFSIKVLMFCSFWQYISCLSCLLEHTKGAIHPPDRCLFPLFISATHCYWASTCNYYLLTFMLLRQTDGRTDGRTRAFHGINGTAKSGAALRQDWPVCHLQLPECTIMASLFSALEGLPHLL